MATFIVGKSFTIDNGEIAPQRRISKLLAFFKFESLPFVEEVSLETLNNEGTQSPILELGAFGNGCRFRPQSRFSFPLEMDNGTGLTVGFWLRPNNILPTISSSTGLLVYYRTALMDKAEYEYSAASGLVTISNGTFSIYEECRDSNKNVLKIHLFDNDDNETVLSTSDYECDKMHHFWIVYDGNLREVKVFIDGISRDVVVEEGSVSSSIKMSQGTYFNFNKSAVGYNTLLRTNTGLLDEVVIINEAVNDQETLGIHINLGAEFAVDETLRWRQEVYQSFGFDDPTALQIGDIYSNGSNIYVGRSDGKLFKGGRLMWEVRRDFANNEEEGFIKKNFLADDSEINFQNGYLKISKANIQIR